MTTRGGAEPRAAGRLARTDPRTALAGWPNQEVPIISTPPTEGAAPMPTDPAELADATANEALREYARAIFGRPTGPATDDPTDPTDPETNELRDLTRRLFNPPEEN